MNEISKEEKATKSGQHLALSSEAHKSNIHQFDRKSPENIVRPKDSEHSEKGINLITSNPFALSPSKVYQDFDLDQGSNSFTSQQDTPKADRVQTQFK